LSKDIELQRSHWIRTNVSVFQPFLWSGTLCSNFDCSRM